ncbi:hypothetical protein ACIQXR_04740 [Peribacillus sp. NPDC097224]
MNIKEYRNLEKSIINIIGVLVGDALMIILALISAYYVIVALIL